MAIGSGEPAQPVHRDQWAFDISPLTTGYEARLRPAGAGLSPAPAERAFAGRGGHLATLL